MKIHSYGVPGLAMLSFSYIIGIVHTITANDLLIYVQIFAGLSAGIYYIQRMFRRDKS